MSEESITPQSTTDNSFDPGIIYKYGKGNLKECLKLGSVPVISGNVVNLYILCKLDTWSRNLKTNFMLGNCLVGAVKLTKNVGPGKYGHTGYGIGFDTFS